MEPPSDTKINGPRHDPAQIGLRYAGIGEEYDRLFDLFEAAYIAPARQDAGLA
jgi:hypothetical protein